MSQLPTCFTYIHIYMYVKHMYVKHMTTIHKDGLSTFLTTQNNPKFNLKQNTNNKKTNPRPK